MTRSFTLLFPLLFFPMLAFSQQKTVSGTVKAADDGALPGVTVIEKGTTNGTVTNANGQFQLSVSTDTDSLEFHYVGYVNHSVSIAGKTSVNVVLSTNKQALSEVVVTALGIKREKRTLGYASQEISGPELTESHQSNLANALQGRVAGVTISSAGGGPGQGASIMIRGINSLDPNKNTTPLFVVDGIPIDNSTPSTLGTTGGRGVQMANRFSDINPDDIQSINILRGGAATALYGLRGANGVVVITTKSAQAGTFRVNYSANYSIDQGDKFPDVQKMYTQGYGGEYDPASFWPEWGPTVAEGIKEDPTHPAELYDQYKHAYVTGHQFRNTLSMSGGTEKASFSSSLSYFKQNGVLPFTYYQDISARFSGRLKFSDQFDMTATVLYTNAGGNFYDADRFNEEMTYWSPRWDVRDYIKPDGTEKTYGNGNAWYQAANNRFKSYVNHVIGDVDFNYSPLKWLTVNYRLGVDEYGDNRTATAPGPKGVPNEYVEADNGQGFIHKYNINFRQINSNLLITLNHKWGDKFGTTLRIGHDLLDRNRDQVSTEGDDLGVYDLFNLGNASTITVSQYDEMYRIIGLYGELSLSYNDYLYLSLTGRNDWTSTLEQNNRSFFYPSASLSYIFSQNIKHLSSWFTYGKFRASLAGIGKDAEPYSTSVVYVPTSVINNVNLWTRNNASGISTLKPEFTTTFEIGTDLKFLNNRLGVEFTWYDSHGKDQIVPVYTAPSTGFTSITLNAGEIKNTGIEVTLNGTPVKNPHFSWDISGNFSHNQNEILSLAPGLDEITVGSQYGYSGATVTLNYVPGESAGDIYGSHWERYYGSGKENPLHVDKSRPMVIGDNGFPVKASDQKILGNAYPKWIAGLNNTFTYKSWSLSFLFDAHLGVQKYDQLNNFMSAFGIAAYTENRNQTIVFPGVTADGQPNTKQVWLGQGIGPDSVDYGAGYYRNVYRGVSENFVEDASWIRLRTLSLSYNLPQSLLKGTFISNASVGFTGNNLWLHTKYIGFDPESSSTPANSSANGFAGFTYPALRSYMFNINVSF